MNRKWVSFEESVPMDIKTAPVNNGGSISSTSSSPIPSVSSSDPRYTAFDKIREDELRGAYLGWSNEILEGDTNREAESDQRIKKDFQRKVHVPQNDYQKPKSFNCELGWSSEILGGGMTLKGA